jgi:hypothetical protein
MIQIDSTMAAKAALETSTEAEKRRQEKEGADSGIADALDVVGAVVDGSDIAAGACRAAVQAMQPKFTTGGDTQPASFVTAGGDGTASGFRTGADCLATDGSMPVDAAEAVDAGSSLVEMAAGAGEAVIDGVGAAIGGMVEGLFSL